MRYFKTCINKLTRKLPFILIVLLAVGLSTAAEASLVVIANPALKIKRLTKDQLAALYLNNPVRLPVNVTAYNQPDNTLSFREFYQQILGWEPSQVSSYWAGKVFSGFSQQPPSVSNDQAAIQLVEHDRNAIAYVDSKSLQHVGNRVKVVYGNYKIPVYQPTKKQQTQTDQLYSSNASNGYMEALSGDPAADNSTDTTGPVSNPDTSLAKQLTQLNDTNNQTGQNIWSLIASHMTMQSQANRPRVQHWILWFQQHPQVVQTMIDNATPYIYYIYQQTQRRHMPAEFALLPMIESGYNPHAYSYVGAAGLWQLMPGTASSYGMAIDWWYDSRRDILTSTKAGLNYLVSLHRRMGTWDLAAASYNAGPGAVGASIQRNKAAGKATDFWDLNLPKQTEEYVPKLLAISAIISHPKKYGIHIPDVPDHPFFGSVTLTSQMDLQEISSLSGVSIPVIKALNPGLQRWATAPKSKFTLLLPVMSVNTFKYNLDRVIGKPHVSWTYHRVTSGESLSSIASKYQTNVAMLEHINHLHSARVKSGEGILVPVHRHQTFTRLAGMSGGVSVMQDSQQKVLADALQRATESQKKKLPTEVTGGPIRSTDNLKSVVSKLYGKD